MDRVFEDYYPCRQNDSDIFHVHNWIRFFISMYNDTPLETYFINDFNDRG
ncbi:MAG TPA: hypothetical protein VFK40_10325 [Nitrososphaeraceae archaeon]|nr:hypothetical protein [Nitrososphaeraceae archaeon]